MPFSPGYTAETTQQQLRPYPCRESRRYHFTVSRSLFSIALGASHEVSVSLLRTINPILANPSRHHLSCFLETAGSELLRRGPVVCHLFFALFRVWGARWFWAQVSSPRSVWNRLETRCPAQSEGGTTKVASVSRQPALFSSSKCCCFVSILCHSLLTPTQDAETAKAGRSR